MGNVLTALAVPSSKTLMQTKPPSGFWLLASGLWLLASGLWLLASGLWLLASGLWLLASGLWLLASGFSLTLLGLLKQGMQGVKGVVCQLPGEQGRQGGLV